MDKLLGVPYIVTAVALAALTGGVAVAVEYWVPWRTDSLCTVDAATIVQVQY